MLPVGKRTLFQHLKALVSSREATDLGRDLVETGKQVVHEVQPMKGAAVPVSGKDAAHEAGRKSLGEATRDGGR
ncbi:MAG: hypothetical protein NVSMB1_06230 [Polyangiales bacterium]